jgi:cobalt-zinc-cadmium efflux system protein
MTAHADDGHGHGHGHASERPDHSHAPASKRSDSTGHSHTHGETGSRQLLIVLVITTSVLVLEVAGGIWTGSLALLADAGHMGTDAAGLVLALIAAKMATRPATSSRTFGYQRAEILAAGAQAVLLFAVGGFVLVEAIRHLISPPSVDARPMAIIGVIALLANAGSLLVLAQADRHNMNLRAASLEVLSDAAGAAAVVVAAIVVATTGFDRADALASLLIALFILPRTWHLLREAVDVLLEAVPRGVDLAEVREHIGEIDGVVGVHDLHAWTISSGLPVLSAHVVVDDATLADGGGGRVLDKLGTCLAGHFDIEHCTFQLEPAGHLDHEAAGHH